MFCCIDAFSSSIVVRLPAAISAIISIKRVHLVSLRRPSGPFRLLIDCRGMPGPIIPLSSAATCYRVRPHINDALIPSQINRLAAGHAHTHTHTRATAIFSQRDNFIIAFGCAGIKQTPPLHTPSPSPVWEHLVRINRVRELVWETCLGFFLESFIKSFIHQVRVHTHPCCMIASPDPLLLLLYLLLAHCFGFTAHLLHEWLSVTAFPAAGSCFLRDRLVSSAHSDGEFRRVLGELKGGSCEASPRWKIKTKIYDLKEVFSSSIPSVSLNDSKYAAPAVYVWIWVILPSSSSWAFIHFCSCFIRCFDNFTYLFFFFNLYLLLVQVNRDCLFYFRLYSLHLDPLLVWMWFRNKLCLDLNKLK